MEVESEFYSGGQRWEDLKSRVACWRIQVIFFMMDWQQIASLLIVGMAAGALILGKLRPRKFNFQRDTHCGCSTSAGASKTSIVFHARRGERGEIIMKMK